MPGAAPRAARSPKARKRLMVVAAFLVYAALCWFVVFPWIDRTFVSRPAL